MKNKGFTLEEYRHLIDHRLSEFFQLTDEDSLQSFAESIRYSLLSGGKRIRGALVLEFYRICGGSPERVLDVACAVEMLHTYSLIHDDLPCMDNDNLRRGKPTNHVMFGECTATLAGDALQAEAFRTILHAELPDSFKLRCAMHLADAVGLDGMCGGQYLDMIGEGQNLTAEQLDAINQSKTGALLTAACLMGVAAAGGDAEHEKAAARYGAAIGMAFQIRDDILDVISTEAVLGKPIGSDREEKKNTYMTLLGLSSCEKLVQQLTEEASSALCGVFDDTAFLRNLADQLAVRKS